MLVVDAIRRRTHRTLRHGPVILLPEQAIHSRRRLARTPACAWILSLNLSALYRHSFNRRARGTFGRVCLGGFNGAFSVCEDAQKSTAPRHVLIFSGHKESGRLGGRRNAYGKGRHLQFRISPKIRRVACQRVGRGTHGKQHHSRDFSGSRTARHKNSQTSGQSCLCRPRIFSKGRPIQWDGRTVSHHGMHERCPGQL